ncbi:MAG TPA: ScpA family protein [Candidatus Paceibacterota bacterium]|nr:ScpA family protein [Candidatus Paceibacterota bacterium]
MTAFTIATEKFNGPLEALLNLIEERRLPISDISLADVTDTYLAYVEKLPSLPLGETAQFVLVASTLLLIKSRTLLPMLELSSEERESVEELERRLARYALIRKSARILRKEWGKNPLLFPRRAPSPYPVFAPGRTTFQMVNAAAMRLVSILPKIEQTAKALVAPVLALEDVIVRLEKRLLGAVRARFSELTKFADRHETIVYFLAMLELVRGGSVSATQERIWSDITLEAESLAAPRYGSQ